MRRLLLVAVSLLVATSFAGEKLLGTIVVTDGGTASNRTTGWTAYACPSNVNGGCFGIGSPTIISVQCDQDCLVCTDMAGCDAGTGVKLGAQQLLPTSTGQAVYLSGRAYNSDGGTTGTLVSYTGGWVSVAPWSTDGGGSTVYARVYQRNGQE